jgi:hypothetical protein
MAVLNKDQDHDISLTDAKRFTKNYRDSDSRGDRKAGFFGADAIRAILDQNDCVGIRIYYGLNDDDEQVMVLVGANENGKDIYNGELMEFSIPCPNICDDTSPLNV